MSDATESPAFIKETYLQEKKNSEEDLKGAIVEGEAEKGPGAVGSAEGKLENHDMSDEHVKTPKVFEDDEFGGGESDNASSPNHVSETEDCNLQDQVEALRKNFRAFERENKALKQALIDEWQKPFQNNSKNLLLGSNTSCRSCLYRCEYGGIYLSVSLEDVDAFLASEAAEASRRSPLGVSLEDSMTIKRDWLNTIALGDIEVDCRWTGEGRRDLRISNGEKSYHLASLCSEGFCLGRSGLRLSKDSSKEDEPHNNAPWLPSLIEFRPFNRLKYIPWIYEFPENESLAVCECSTNGRGGSGGSGGGGGFIACVSHDNILRVFGLGGNLCHTELLAPIVCLSAEKDILSALVQLRPGRSQKLPNMLEPNPLHHEGKQVAVNLEDHSRFTIGVYQALVWKIDPCAKCPVERIDCSPELHSSPIKWFGLTTDASQLPVVINSNFEAIALSYSTIQSGYKPRQLTNQLNTQKANDYFTEHARVAASENLEENHRSPRVLTKYSDTLRCLSYVSSWLPVARNLDSLKLKDFLVHSCSTKYLDLLPLTTSFVCHPLTRVYFQTPLCLPPALIALKNKYPIDLANITAFNTLSKEEKLAKGFNPLTSHFLDEQTVRFRNLTLLPILRNASWRSAGLEISSSLIESFFEAKSLVEVACTQGALMALQDNNVSAFSQCLAHVDNKKALTLIERQVGLTKNGDFHKAWTERFHHQEDAIDSSQEDDDEENVIRQERREGGYGREVARGGVSRKESLSSKQGQDYESVQVSGKNQPPASGVGVKTDLASLISGSIDLRNNSKKRRVDF